MQKNPRWFLDYISQAPGSWRIDLSHLLVLIDHFFEDMALVSILVLHITSPFLWHRQNICLAERIQHKCNPRDQSVNSLGSSWLGAAIPILASKATFLEVLSERDCVVKYKNANQGSPRWCLSHCSGTGFSSHLCNKMARRHLPIILNYLRELGIFFSEVADSSGSLSKAKMTVDALWCEATYLCSAFTSLVHTTSLWSCQSSSLQYLSTYRFRNSLGGNVWLTGDLIRTSFITASHTETCQILFPWFKNASIKE